MWLAESNNIKWNSKRVINANLFEADKLNSNQNLAFSNIKSTKLWTIHFQHFNSDKFQICVLLKSPTPGKEICQCKSLPLLHLGHYTLLGSQSEWVKDKPILLMHFRHATNLYDLRHLRDHTKDSCNKLILKLLDTTTSKVPYNQGIWFDKFALVSKLGGRWRKKKWQ